MNQNQQVRFYKKIECEGISTYIPAEIEESIRPEDAPFKKIRMKAKHIFGNTKKGVFLGMNTAPEGGDEIMKELGTIYIVMKYRLRLFEMEKLLENKDLEKGVLSYSYLDDEGEEQFQIMSLWKTGGRRILLVLQSRAREKKKWEREFFRILGRMKEDNA